MKPVGEAESPGGAVTAVERSLKILEAFQVSHPVLRLAEIAAQTGLHKTTALRLIRTLEAHGYLARRPDGRWRLGPAAARLGARYTATFDADMVILPALQELSRTSNESASLFVREGDIRICIARVEGPSPIRHSQGVGRALPLDLGAPGKVLLAFSGERGEVFDRIRAVGFCISVGERHPEISSIAVPVYGIGRSLFGALSVSGPTSRLTRQKLLGLKLDVLGVAADLSIELGDEEPA